MNNIKHLGDEKPVLALEMLDSLSSFIIYEPLHTRMTFQLLRIRLQDKAYVIPGSDKQIQEILPYFLENGNVQERQEALFYAGSVYRDLNDTPRALDYFLKSKDEAEKSKKSCDSIMLRNTYSNLCYLFGCEHDNMSTLEYARKEYDLSLALGNYSINSIMHIGEALFACDSIDSSLHYFDKILQNAGNMYKLERGIIARLLYIYAYVHENENADKCFDILSSMESTDQVSVQELFALGEYYRINGKDKEAIDCIQQILDNTNDLASRYDASRYLYILHRNVGNEINALDYGDMFIDVCGELNLGKRQELAATVNNIYKYNRDKDNEQKLIMENRAYQERNRTIVFVCIFLFALGLAAFAYYRYWQLKKILTLRCKIENINEEKNKIAQESRSRQAELIAIKNELDNITERLSETRNSLKETTEEVHKLSEELIAKESVLKEKIEQNKTIVSLMHQSEFEESAEEIIVILKKSGNGLKRLTEKEWNMLYYAVDKLWPAFKEQMCMKLGKVTDQQRQVCYLMRAGFSPTQIQNIIGLSRTTMWRCTKKYDWIYSIF